MTHEDLLRLANKHSYRIAGSMRVEDSWQAAFELGRLEEREACANVCDEYRWEDGDGQHVAWYAGVDGCISAILARGKK